MTTARWRIRREMHPRGWPFWRVRDGLCRYDSGGEGCWCGSFETHDKALAWVGDWYAIHPD